MELSTRKQFDVIFQEAHVIDFDFSKWDREISLVVIAGLIGSNFDGKGPIHNVRFQDVKEIQWTSTHLEVQLDSDNKHCQWVIMDFSVQKVGGILSILLDSVAPPCPKLRIDCRDVKIHELGSEIVDSVNPLWNRPYSPLARPGLEELSKRCRH